ncbi:hypothetical protein [Polyangium spumosum]|uniref:Uncharacterized protein n=1 Tax=Polyangium spumosum TaxID=889282 RepID=A0A6N7Q3U5_9BACT|nr:hypothetical protein [Polyangium spumosum]MRG97530.1 hypothetical protein [Polyangium spumosum]
MLRRAKRMSLAADVEAATLKVLALARAHEDANGPVQDALADRDGADDDLDLTAKSARGTLAGRAVDAARKGPYTLIFPDGIDYYTAAPLDKQVSRYGELIDRLEEHLPGGDPVRLEAVPALKTGIAAFTGAVEMLAKARTDEALAGTRLEAAEDEWARLLTKVYGFLLAELGRAAAERFFPKAKSGTKKPGGDRG